MALAPDLTLMMAERVVQLWRWSGYAHQKDFARECSGDETLMSKWKKGESLTTEHVLRLAHFSAGLRNVVNDPAMVLLFLFGMKDEGDVWVPNMRLVESSSEAVTSATDRVADPGYLRRVA